MSQAGHECVGACEIDEYARRVYGRHFPDIRIWEDATKINPSELPEFDCLVGGFPCQAFSIAGQRRGFEDTRGSLFFEIARIAKERRPQYLLLENVKGLLNHDEGRTFRVIISTLQELGYSVEWQVLNSKYFVPQNRERVFIVGHLGGFSGGKIFPLGEVGKKLVCAGQEKQRRGKGISEQCSTTLQSTPYKGSSTYVSTIDANYYKGPDGKRTMIEEPKIKMILNDGHDTNRLYDPDGIARSLRANSGGMGSKTGLYAVKPKMIVPDNFSHKAGDGTATRKHHEKNISPALQAKPGGNQQSYVKIVADRSRNLANKGRNLESPKDISNSLTSVAKDNYVMTLIANHNSNMKNRTQERKETWALQTSGAEFGITQGTRIRRLTPLECERLQGFPDNWTEGLSDTQRYKCCGNAVTVPVVHYIAKHLVL